MCFDKNDVNFNVNFNTAQNKIMNILSTLLTSTCTSTQRHLNVHTTSSQRPYNVISTSIQRPKRREGVVWTLKWRCVHSGWDHWNHLCIVLEFYFTSIHIKNISRVTVSRSPNNSAHTYLHLLLTPTCLRAKNATNGKQQTHANSNIFINLSAGYTKRIDFFIACSTTITSSPYHIANRCK